MTLYHRMWIFTLLALNRLDIGYLSTRINSPTGEIYLCLTGIRKASGTVRAYFGTVVKVGPQAWKAFDDGRTILPGAKSEIE